MYSARTVLKVEVCSGGQVETPHASRGREVGRGYRPHPTPSDYRVWGSREIPSVVRGSALAIWLFIGNSSDTNNQQF